jgi:hypothetical protein
MRRQGKPVIDQCSRLVAVTHWGHVKPQDNRRGRNSVKRFVGKLLENLLRTISKITRCGGVTPGARVALSASLGMIQSVRQRILFTCEVRNRGKPERACKAEPYGSEFLTASKNADWQTMFTNIRQHRLGLRSISYLLRGIFESISGVGQKSLLRSIFFGPLFQASDRYNDNTT